ncbi:hypothetical protein Fmac_013721 [Flemingia macrophylla]|uniref:Uncharacterized protein n=1 Tax=Flemingia macrophylla TaxID=520843 RepID=A0ABD1MW63_9FABA
MQTTSGVSFYIVTARVGKIEASDVNESNYCLVGHGSGKFFKFQPKKQTQGFQLDGGETGLLRGGEVYCLVPYLRESVEPRRTTDNGNVKTREVKIGITTEHLQLR